MARQRMLHPDFFTDPKIVRCTMPARMVFLGMLGLADREGRLEADPLALKLRILPADNADMPKLLAELAKQRLITLYEVVGQSLALVNGFTKRQKPHPKEPPSSLPPPQPYELPNAVEKHGEPGKNTEGTSESESESESESVKALAGERPPAPAPEKLAEAWNDYRPAECSTVKADELNEARKRKARARLREHPSLDDWIDRIARLRESDFCRGLTTRSTWRADFDWLLRPGTFDKIGEGSFDGQQRQGFDPNQGILSHG